MPLISHGDGRRYVIALSGKSLNNSHPTAALATKLGRRYIVSFPRPILLYLIVETSSRTMHRIHSFFYFQNFRFERFIYLFFIKRSINRLNTRAASSGNAKEENVMETDWTVTSNNFANHTVTDQRNNWNSAGCTSVTAHIC